MAYLTELQLSEMGFKFVGRDVKVSDKASIYNCDQIEIGDYSRIDDFCVISGRIKIGRNVHITPMCLVAGGELGLVIEDFVALAYGVKLFTQSDDYSGETLVNSTVPAEFKKEIKLPVSIGKYCILGAGTIVMPGVTVGEGTSVGAGSLVLKSTDSWGIVAGIPAKKIKDRKKGMVMLAEKYLKSEENDSI